MSIQEMGPDSLNQEGSFRRMSRLASQAYIIESEELLKQVVERISCIISCIKCCRRHGGMAQADVSLSSELNSSEPTNGLEGWGDCSLSLSLLLQLHHIFTGDFERHSEAKFGLLL